MKMGKKIICLTVLLALFALPASAFASSASNKSGASSYLTGKGLVSSILSLFGISTKDNGSSKKKNDYGKDINKYFPIIPDKKYKKNDFWDWVKNNTWWEDYCWWLENSKDSAKIWEKYYCY